MSGVLGFIFDLDGTLVDSRLDFDAMRRDMGLPDHSSILEEIAGMEESRAARCQQILQHHEMEGARRARPIPGALEFIAHLKRTQLKCAVVTRNSRAMAERMLRQCELQFDPLICREDGPVKPDPWALLHICEYWNLPPNRVAMLGDFRFDIEAGKAAGTHTVFFARGREHHELPGIEAADYRLDSFHQSTELLTRLGIRCP